MRTRSSRLESAGMDNAADKRDSTMTITEQEDLFQPRIPASTPAWRNRGDWPLNLVFQAN